MRDKPFFASVGDFLAEVFVSDPPTQIQHSALGFFWKNGKSKSVSMSWDSSTIVVGPPGLMANGIIILEIWTDCTSL